MHLRIAGSRIHSSANCRPSLGPNGAAHHYEQHGNDRHRIAADGHGRRIDGLCPIDFSSLILLFAIRAVMQAWILDATPRNMGGTSIGILFGVQAIGAAIGPALGGILADKYGLIATFYFLALTIIIANFLIFFTPTKSSVVFPARPEPS